ncbi:MAG: 50S ribosomal protein L25 [Halobacteriovoraceae bacterium]|jgi:large subunit ribosomal protein L25|nr:50S ribosomal protein L25 [Halobacteriovoraceae bacterium]
MYELLKTEDRANRAVTKARAVRKEGFVPGVIFGKEMDASVNFKVNNNQLSKFLHHSGQVFECQIGTGEKHLVTLAGVDHDATGSHILHISLHKIPRNQATTVNLPIHFIGDAIGAKEEGSVVQELHDHIEVTGLPSKMPEYIEVDVTNLEINHHYSYGDLKLPEGLELASNPEENVVTCHHVKLQVVEEPEVEEEVAAEADASAEGATAGTETPAADANAEETKKAS